jgi:hypothetical protein
LNNLNKLPVGKYFLKKAFCLLTTQVPASRDLNKLNIFLKRASTEKAMFAPFEEYVSRILFKIPLPKRSISHTMRIFLPRIAYPDLSNDVNTLPSLKSFKSVTISNEETKFLLLDQTAAENEAEKI